MHLGLDKEIQLGGHAWADCARAIDVSFYASCSRPSSMRVNRPRGIDVGCSCVEPC
jgi:hypothetical protein